jgi:hypothetical protein
MLVFLMSSSLSLSSFCQTFPTRNDEYHQLPIAKAETEATNTDSQLMLLNADCKFMVLIILG